MFQFAQPHRPEYILPGWLVYLRIAQGIIAVVVLVLSAFAAAKFVDSTADTATFVSSYPGFGFCWFAFAWTALYIPAAIFVIPKFPDKIKSIVMFLIMDILSTIWWLVGFGLLTSAAVLLGAVLDIVINAFGSDPRTTVYDDYLQAWTIGCDVTRACVGVVGLEFILFALALAFVGTTLFRKSGCQDSRIAMSNGTALNVHEDSKEARQGVPYPTEAAELSTSPSP